MGRYQGVSRGAITQGAYKPGDRIVETRIAQQLGVSQALVREAIRDLESLGLLESAPFRGAWVRQITPEEVSQFYTVRAVLEGAAARAAGDGQ
ncbi:MAG: GntR family transcriptional regulator [Chloroflexaceae bacterium]|nr:GntR family transcriptional regulator [Chloroflexaceae bacterium]